VKASDGTAVEVYEYSPFGRLLQKHTAEPSDVNQDFGMGRLGAVLMNIQLVLYNPRTVTLNYLVRIIL